MAQLSEWQTYLIEWAKELGQHEAYSFGQKPNYRAHIAEQLAAHKDIIPNQEAANAYLNKIADQAFDNCYGWTWTLRIHLEPLFATNASVDAIETKAAEYQGALPDFAVINLLIELKNTHQLRAYNRAQDMKWRKVA